MTRIEKIRNHYRMYAIPFKSIVRYGENERIICKFYAENTDFMFKASAKSHKHMDRLINDLYRSAQINNITEYGI